MWKKNNKKRVFCPSFFFGGEVEEFFETSSHFFFGDLECTLEKFTWNPNNKGLEHEFPFQKRGDLSRPYLILRGPRDVLVLWVIWVEGHTTRWCMRMGGFFDLNEDAMLILGWSSKMQGNSYEVETAIVTISFFYHCILYNKWSSQHIRMQTLGVQFPS